MGRCVRKPKLELALSCRLSMIFSENRYPLFRIKLQTTALSVVVIGPWLGVVRPGLLRIRPWPGALARGGVLLWCRIGFKYRTAGFAELRRISPQACHDPVHIGDLRAAQPPDIGRAGHLLVHRSAVLLRERRILNTDAAADRYRKAQKNSMRSHAPSFFRIQIGVRFRTADYLICSLKINAAWKGSRRTKKCEDPYSTLPIFFTAAIRRAESSVTNFENSGASI